MDRPLHTVFPLLGANCFAYTLPAGFAATAFTAAGGGSTASRLRFSPFLGAAGSAGFAAASVAFAAAAAAAAAFAFAFSC